MIFVDPFQLNIFHDSMIKQGGCGEQLLGKEFRKVSANLIVFCETFGDYCTQGKQKDGVLLPKSACALRGRAGLGWAVPGVAEGSAGPSGPGPLRRKGGKDRAPPPARAP